jgi:hypothetical protein
MRAAAFIHISATNAGAADLPWIHTLPSKPLPRWMSSGLLDPRYDNVHAKHDPTARCRQKSRIRLRMQLGPDVQKIVAFCALGFVATVWRTQATNPVPDQTIEDPSLQLSLAIASAAAGILVASLWLGLLSDTAHEMLDIVDDVDSDRFRRPIDSFKKSAKSPASDSAITQALVGAVPLCTNGAGANDTVQSSSRTEPSNQSSPSTLIEEEADQNLKYLVLFRSRSHAIPARARRPRRVLAPHLSPKGLS